MQWGKIGFKMRFFDISWKSYYFYNQLYFLFKGICFTITKDSLIIKHGILIFFSHCTAFENHKHLWCPILLLICKNITSWQLTIKSYMSKKVLGEWNKLILYLFAKETGLLIQIANTPREWELNTGAENLFFIDYIFLG